MCLRFTYSPPMQEALSVIGFVPDEISMVLELLSAILNLGNIQFASKHMQDGCTITDKEREYSML